MRKPWYRRRLVLVLPLLWPIRWQGWAWSLLGVGGALALTNYWRIVFLLPRPLAILILVALYAAWVWVALRNSQRQTWRGEIISADRDANS